MQSVLRGRGQGWAPSFRPAMTRDLLSSTLSYSHWPRDR